MRRKRLALKSLTSASVVAERFFHHSKIYKTEKGFEIEGASRDVPKNYKLIMECRDKTIGGFTGCRRVVKNGQ